MKTANALSISLETRYVRVLDRIARKAGSKSAAVRTLLDAYERAEAERDIESIYAEYYADPAARKADRDLTVGMLSLTAWPKEWVSAGETGRGRH